MSPNLRLNGRSIAREAMQVTLLDRQGFKCRYMLNSSKSTQCTALACTPFLCLDELHSWGSCQSQLWQLPPAPPLPVLMGTEQKQGVGGEGVSNSPNQQADCFALEPSTTYQAVEQPSSVKSTCKQVLPIFRQFTLVASLLYECKLKQRPPQHECKQMSEAAGARFLINLHLSEVRRSELEIVLASANWL